MHRTRYRRKSIDRVPASRLEPTSRLAIATMAWHKDQVWVHFGTERRRPMPVLMTAVIPGATKELIEGMEPLLEQLRRAKGFRVHTNGPVSEGWRVVEVWDSQEDFEAWFEAFVKPAFADGGPMPSITIDPLNQFETV
jgi:hypothetical protein